MVDCSMTPEGLQGCHTLHRQEHQIVFTLIIPLLILVGKCRTSLDKAVT